MGVNRTKFFLMAREIHPETRQSIHCPQAHRLDHDPEDCPCCNHQAKNEATEFERLAQATQLAGFSH